MVRKQVYITAEQDTLLKRLAAASGLTEAEIMRAALDALAALTYEQPKLNEGQVSKTAVMEKYVAETARDWAGLAIDGTLADAAWQKELAFIRSLGKRKAGKTAAEAWKFNRDEL